MSQSSGKGTPSGVPAAGAPLVRLAGACFDAGGTPILRDINWDLFPGQHWVVMGPNGAGKTTLLRLLRGDLWPTSSRSSRVYQLNGAPQISPVGFKESTALVSPELLERYQARNWNFTGWQVVCSGFAESVYLFEEPDPAQRQQALEVMETLGLAHLAGRPLMEMSLGQARRVLIARALVKKPRLLVLDECAEGLDRASRLQVLELVEQLADQGTQILQAAHRPEELFSGLTHALVLRQGRVIEQGSLEEISLPRPAATAAPVAQAAPPWTPPRAEYPFLYRLQGVEVVRDERQVLSGIDWLVEPGQHWAVLGANGAGKSSLLSLLLGDHYPKRGGRITRFGAENPRSIWAIRQRTGLVSAELQARHCHSQSVLSAVLSGLFGSIGTAWSASPEDEARARAWLDFMGLPGCEQRDLLSLSYGQKRKVMLARALIHQPQALLLDEPLGGLDENTRREVLELLQRLASAGVSLVYVTHHYDELLPAVSHVALLEEGRMLWQGTREEYLAWLPGRRGRAS